MRCRRFGKTGWQRGEAVLERRCLSPADAGLRTCSDSRVATVLTGVESVAELCAP